MKDLTKTAADLGQAVKDLTNGLANHQADNQRLRAEITALNERIKELTSSLAKEKTDNKLFMDAIGRLRALVVGLYPRGPRPPTAQ